MRAKDRPLAWLHREIKSPPFSATARLEAGSLLRAIQIGEKLGMPHSRPMPGIGARCHELRVNDEGRTWRVMYRIDPDAILILDVFEKKTKQTPAPVMDKCRRRLRHYEENRP